MGGKQGKQDNPEKKAEPPPKKIDLKLAKAIEKRNKKPYRFER